MTKTIMTVAIDFDGVLHQYDGWQGKKSYNPPVEGAKEALDHLYEEGYIIIIHTCRKSVGGVKKWLKKHKITYHFINENPYAPEDCCDRKVFADIYIDDRAIRFTSWDQTLKDFEKISKEEKPI